MHKLRQFHAKINDQNYFFLTKFLKLEIYYEWLS